MIQKRLASIISAYPTEVDQVLVKHGVANKATPQVLILAVKDFGEPFINDMIEKLKINQNYLGAPTVNLSPGERRYLAQRGNFNQSVLVHPMIQTLSAYQLPAGFVQRMSYHCKRLKELFDSKVPMGVVRRVLAKEKTRCLQERGVSPQTIKALEKIEIVDSPLKSETLDISKILKDASKIEIPGRSGKKKLLAKSSPLQTEIKDGEALGIEPKTTDSKKRTLIKNALGIALVVAIFSAMFAVISSAKK